MNSKIELIEACKRILWLEKEMRDSYAFYKNILSDESMKSAIKEIENDEIRHMNLSEKILTILQK